MRLNVHTRDDSGFAVIWVLGICILVLVLGSFFFQVGNVLVQREKLVSAADAASTAGATALDEDALVSGSGILLDPDVSPARCLDSLDNAATGNASGILNNDGAVSTCELDGDDTIVATARGNMSFGPMLSAFGLDEVELSVTSRARPSCSDTNNVEAGC